MRKFDEETMICKECGLHWGRHYGERCPSIEEQLQQGDRKEREARYQKKRQEPYKIGAVLRKYDGGFFKLIRYKSCQTFRDNVPCSLRDQCGGKFLMVQPLFGDKVVVEYCPVHYRMDVKDSWMMFDEVKSRIFNVKRSIILGEGWL